jgi:hypothetical protein
MFDATVAQRLDPSAARTPAQSAGNERREAAASIAQRQGSIGLADTA